MPSKTHREQEYLLASNNNNVSIYTELTNR